MGRDSAPRPSRKSKNGGGKGGAPKDGIVMIDPINIRFTHSRIRPRFSGCNKTIEETKDEIRKGVITPADLPHITVMFCTDSKGYLLSRIALADGPNVSSRCNHYGRGRPLEDGKTYCSLNNRRLHVIHWARAEGYLAENLIGVRVKPMEQATRHAAKYSLDRCAVTAKVMRESAGAATADESSRARAGDVDATKNDAASVAATVTGPPETAAPTPVHGCGVGEYGTDSVPDQQKLPHRLPTAFLNHGGGPLPILDDPGHSALVKSIRQFARSLSVAPVAVVLVTAHWLEESGPGVTSAARPELLFDYYGFPSKAYTATYNAPGDPALAARVASLLQGAGFDHVQQTDRAWDHGTFIPMMIGFPDATIPIVQLSLLASQDSSQHLAMGRALAPLRDEGVLILGSGMSYHNMGAFRGSGSADSNAAASAEFDAWLFETCTKTPAKERDARLENWDSAPGARECHPPSAAEHLLPLLVVAGAAGEDSGFQSFHQNDFFGRFTISNYRFGDP